MTYDLAKQLGPDVLRQVFTDKKAIPDMLSEVVVELDQPEQCLTVRMAEDVEPHCQLRQVRVRKIKITKRDASGDGASRKSKHVAPQQPTLRATLDCLIDSAEKVHQKFLCDFFAKDMFFSFEPEQKNMFDDAVTEDDDGEDEDDDAPKQSGLRLAGKAPQPDPEAGDVLDDEKAAKKTRGKKKGAKGQS